MNRDRAKIVLEQALEKMLVIDIRPKLPHGFPRTIGERPLVFRLAHYMIECGAKEDGLNVDCDYNCHGTTVKELLAPKTEAGFPDDMSEQSKPKRFFPDLVVHRRGTTIGTSWCARSNGSAIIAKPTSTEDVSPS
jgi:hypothetical protein